MSKEQFQTDFSKYLESKINARNKVAQNDQRNDKLVDFLDREIDFLEKCEVFFIDLEKENSSIIKGLKEKSFNDGVNCGRLNVLTGRNHAQYF